MVFQEIRNTKRVKRKSPHLGGFFHGRILREVFPIERKADSIDQWLQQQAGKDLLRFPSTLF